MPDDTPYPPDRAWNYALWLLGRQAYTEAQIAEKLRRKGATDETVEGVLLKLRDLRLVDDELYAERFVESRGRRKGVLAIKQALRQKGVSEALVAKTLEAVDDETQERAARETLEKNRWRFRGEPAKARAKAYTFLARRGFPSDVVMGVLEGQDFASEDEGADDASGEENP